MSNPYQPLEPHDPEPQQQPAFIEAADFPGPLTISGALTYEDMILTKRLGSKPNTVHIGFRHVIGLMIFIFTVVFFMSRSPLSNVPQAILNTLSKCQIPLIVLGLYAYLLRKQDKQDRSASATGTGAFALTTYQLDEDGIQMKKLDISSTHRWPAFSGYTTDSETLVQVTLSGVGMGSHLFPRRWFESDDDWDRLLKIVKCKVPSSQPSP